MIRSIGVLLAVFAVLGTQGCVQQDITFMVDSSQGVGAENFRKELDFIKSTISDYDTSPGCIRISIVTYGTTAHNQFYLDRYQTKNQILGAIDNIQYQPGRPYATEGLKFLTDESFSSLHGARQGVPHVGVMVMSSPPSNSQAFQQEAQRAKNAGMKLYSVGVGSGAHLPQLSTAASTPSNEYSFTAQNFDSLGDLSYPLYHAITRETPALSANTAQCLQRADLVFLVDSSGSIGASNFLKLKDFLKGITGQLNIGPNAVHVGLMQFSNYPSMEFPLDTYTSRGGVMTGIDNMKYMQGGTNTGDAIKYMTNQMFSQNSGARSNVPRIAVVITDGRSSSSSLTSAASDQARLANIGMLAVGVGSGVDVNELHSIADDPDSQNTFTVNSFDQLNSISSQIINKACQVSATAAPRVTSSPGGTIGPDPCADLLGNCKQYGQQVCSTYAPWAKDNCARYCGLCQPLYTTAPPPCVDLLTNCPSYGTDVCLKPTYKGWAEDNCRKFCGFCGPATSAVGFYGQCSYKGTSYKHGEKWTDGCDYECVCEDGNSGRYRCYNRCPLYYNLPPQCTLVRSPSECCQQPVCNFNSNINNFEVTAPATNSFGMSVCAYKGKQYFGGQSWDDGCQYRCTCTSGSTGLIQCQDRCPSYNSLPPYCHLEKKAGECCSKPVCEFSTQQGSFTGTGSVSGLGVGLTPTQPPACVNALANCDRYEATVCTNFPGWASDNCRKHCNLCNVKPTPGPNDTCLYQGRIYHQGQGWMASCDTQCVCENAAYGYYRCVNTCPTYNNLPQGCYETKKAGECCSTVQCDTGSFLTSTNNLNTIGNGGMISIQNPSKPQIAPTLPSGGKPQPGTGGTGFTAPTLSGCLYKGNMYIQGQKWEDGCDYSCQCTDSKTGYYSCTQRCPTYQNLPIGCHMSLDPDDSCCQKPVCNDPSTPLIPSFQQGNIGHGIVEPPSVTDLYNNTYNTIHYVHIYTSNVVAPTAPSVTSRPGIGYCLYKGQQHNQGQTWQDGCSYNCVCEDASIGKWRCTERCRKYPNLPANFCRLVPDPQDSCCTVPYCDFTPTVNSFNGSAAPITIPQTPRPITTTPIPTTPRPKVCIYNGKQYAQGQLWYDGCQYKCTCDDAEHGFFRCTNRCPEYKNVPASCTMVKDAQDPACCEVPYCNFQTTSSSQTGQGVVPSLPPGSFQGQSPDQTNPNIGFCLYKGQQYLQGQTWLDGCEYSCNCQDATRGLYTCNDRCPRYGSIPYPCKLVTDYRQPCCKIPDCQFGGSLGEITGTLTPAPFPGITNAPTPGVPGQPGQPTPSPMLNYCIYKGVKYYQDQTWDDGCDKRCRCDDSSKGLYVCDTRCASYANNLPAECHMVVSPTDSCCREPKCDIPASLQNITGTIRPDMIPTLAPPGIFIGSANTPTPRPNIGPNPVATPAPKPLNYCEYKGSKYSQGQTWDDACDLTCQCIDASTGNYRCTEKCPKYGTLPPQCYLQKDPANPCCSKPECTFNPSAGQINGQVTTLAPVPGQSIAPTPYPGYKPTPGPNPSPALPKDVCEYKGKSYTQGQTWYDDCEYICSCENAPAGVYRCSRRCPQYQQPAGCTLIQDPKDPLCCKVPKCNIPPQYNNATGYIPIPTPPPGVITGGSVTQVPTPAPGQQPTLSPGGSPTLAPGVSPNPAPTYCQYKNQQYTQGQKWQDGCDYNCECVDAMNGRYRCTELCPRYPALPAQCRLVADAIQPCCKKPYCEFTGTVNNVTGTVTLSPNPLNTPVPNPGQVPQVGPTPSPNAPDTCLYNGVPFKQGATWDDGCDLKCVCEDGAKGFYRCSDRCPRYNTLPDGCVLITDPRDSCCRIPDCKPVAQSTNAPTPGVGPTLGPGATPNPNPNPNPTPNPNPNPNPSPNPMIPSVTNVINGQGVTPTPGPNMPQPTGPPVCFYKGVSYQQGQTWQDGCDYNCVCTEASTGKYRCSQRCQIYPNLPSNCRLALDPADQCCRVAVCNPTPSPGITPGVTPNPNPNPNPTLGPQIGQTTPGLNPSPGMTPNPNPSPQPTPKNVCIMNGRQYTQGQQWYTNGCDRTCVCDDATTGFYRCYDRCRKYDSIPSGCTLVSDPNDPQCCKVPQCIPTPGVNGFPTPGPTDSPQLITGVPVGIINGYGTPTPSPNPTPLPGQTPNPNPQPTPAPKEVCVYKGTEYHQGQRWVDGCKYTCVCVDSKTGHYECTEKCPVYPRLPPYCRLVQDPMNICCQKPLCDFNNIPTPGPIGGPTPAPHPTPGFGSTIEPGPNVGTSMEPGPIAYCVYNGVPYTQSQSWDVGCTKRCRCDDASKNYYSCFDRCPIYPAQQGCTLVTDPKDACCQIPRCVVIPTPGPTPNPNPNPNVNPNPNPTLVPPTGTTLEPPPNTQAPNIGPGLTPVATPFPSPVPTGQTGVIIGKPQNPQNPSGVCEYKGVQYTTGQTWDDGCTYRCECLDQISGQYKCTERCPRFVQIPAYCVLVSDPNDQCCRTPSCPNLTPTLKPGYTPALQPTLYPPVSTHVPPFLTQPTPGVNTPAPSVKPPLPKNVCVMNGKSYTQGQKWDDGCARTCVCSDGVTGHYTCTDRCPQYNNISPSCVMVPDPSDPICCKVPQCGQPNPNVNPTGIVGTITGNNPYPTAQPTPQPNPNPNPNVNPTPNPNPNPNVNPTPNPNPNPNLNPTPNPNPNPNVNPTPNPYPYPTPYPGGTYPPYMLTAIPVPGATAVPVPGVGSTPGPTPKVCVYKGAMYQTGQRWRDGCDYDCICEDGMTGKYRCTTVCPKYPNLPSGCRLVMDMNNPCCKKADCSPVPGTTPVPIPGQSPTPNPNPTPTPAFCVFNGIPFKQGQTWQDGCSRTCKCEDAMSRQITCDDRCPTYPSLKAGCTLVTDPKDQCCQVPQCINPNATNPLMVVTGPKGTIEGSNLPQPGINNPGTTGKSDACLYNGKVYQPGQTWDDGCTYQCICTDGSTGHYQCTERCPKIPNIPSTCTLVKDPADQCCQKVYCPNAVPTPGPTPNPNPNPNGQPTPNPNPNLTPNPNPNATPNPNPNATPNPNPTPAPQPSVCQYKGQNYQQGQTWYDGCNAKCRCESAATGYYRCQERCSRYPSVPAACTLVPSPSDPSCCKEPSCPVIPTSGPTPTPGFIPNPMTPKPGEITGLAPVPTNMPTPAPGVNPTPGINPTPAPRKGCFYKGVVHPKGSTWDDGCQYTCECLDDMSGQYKCLEKCAKFPNLDSRCVLLQDPSELCCKKPYCDLVNPTPFPNGVPTPKPNIAPTPGGIAPGMMTTPSPYPTTPRPGFCVYKGVAYTQGKQWNDGCSQKCQCDDSTTGYYTCHARCPSYPQVPSSCVLRTDPSDSCCLVPDCNQILAPVGPTSQTGTNPINVSPGTGTGPSGSGPTPAPQYVYPTPVQPGTFTGTGSNPNPQNPNPNPSNTGSRSVCIYKAQMYTQGQKWDDGCQYRCECIDAVRGQYRCTGRCPQYYFLPPQCTYVQDPNDQCCQKARCNPNPMATPQPQITPSPTVPIVVQPGTNQPHTGTGNPIVVQPGTNPPQTGTGNPIVVQPGTNPPQTGGSIGPIPQTTSMTGTGTVCVYKGKTYPKGQMWRDGCDYQCICDDPATNAYRCVATCKSYSTVPSFCTLTPDPKDQCCEVVSCTAPNGQQLTPMLPSNVPTASPTLTPNLLHVIPIGTHDVFTGTGHPPLGTGQGSSGGRSGCVYKNKVYTQGQSWDDGCKYTCTCEDGADGRYRCATKCPSYPAIPKYCTYVNVPGQCCPSLSCNSPDYGKYTPTPQLVPSPAPSINPGTQPGQVPTPAPNTNPHIIVVPGAGTSAGGTAPININPGTPLAGFSGTTSQYCIYKNKLYNQGNTWNDGCDYSCECLDGRSGYYKCKPLCPVYDKLPSQCFMVRAADQCCAQPMCSNPDGSQVNPLTGQSPYPVYGSYPGGFTGFKPSYSPSQGSSSGTSGTTPGCVYKGVLYNQGQKWDDGCDYQCTCTNANNGLYTCYAKCPSYTSIPPVCKMYDVPGQCCQEIRCDTSGMPTTPRAPLQPTPVPHPHIDPNCYDMIDNCNMYGLSACGSNYQTWAHKNCNKYCGFCTSTITSPPPVCEDKVNNCADYGKSACTGIYKPWATDNCIKYCNLCTGTGSGSVVTSRPATQSPFTGQCVDKLNNCQNYDASTCQDQRYTAWAHENCPKFCGFCTGTGGTVSQPVIINALPPQGWFTMLKGVAGAPGDLFTIWNRPGGYNENVPQAMYLTNQFPGHYKPSLSDHWNDLCIDQVKVSIYNGGQEKAYITFNAVGADKNSWFTADRIIDSSYTDIRNAPKELFSLMGDVTSGREFTMNSHSTGNCDTYGWMMVATQSGCSFEASAGNKPAFLYSPGQTALHWGQATASGDVFAITAHGNCGASLQSTQQTGFTQMSRACIYKGKIYSQGDHWTDGCEYNCTCVDETTGRYNCVNLCATFTNLPQGCTLVKKPGECCALPDCGNYTLPGSGQGSGFCYYKGQMHGQGEQWNDGCDYKCTCQDATTGTYRCTDRCYKWNLPAGLCTLDPAPAGKCCPVPNCSSQVVLQYPPGYVQE